jgi:hypothetical protein
VSIYEIVELDGDVDNEFDAKREPDEGLLETALVTSSVLSAGAALLLLKSSCSTVTQLGWRFNYKKGNKKGQLGKFTNQIKCKSTYQGNAIIFSCSMDSSNPYILVNFEGCFRFKLFDDNVFKLL